MWSIDAHEKDCLSSCDDDRRVGGFPLSSNSTTEALVLLGAAIDFINCWIKPLEHNVLQRGNMYVFNMKKLFQKIPAKLSK